MAGLQINNKYLPRLRRLTLPSPGLQDPVEELTVNFKRLNLQAAWYIVSYQIISLTPNDAVGVESLSVRKKHKPDFIYMVESHLN